MLIPHTFPRTFSMSFNRLNDITIEHCQQISDDIKKDLSDGRASSIKPVLLSACANIFTEYFTTRTFETSDKRFQQLIKNFDKIFWEVNQGYAADFLPFLLPFHTKRIKQLEKWSHEIRTFILEDIIGDRFTTWNVGNEPNDYIESLIDHVKRDSLPRFEWETVSKKRGTEKENKELTGFYLGIICIGRYRWRAFGCRKFPRQGDCFHRTESTSTEEHSSGSR